VFVVASARDNFDPAKVLFEFDGVRRDTAPSREAGQRIAPCVTNGPPFSRTGNERVEAEAMVIVDCGVEITGPLSARDYKDPGTDGLNKNSAKMIPVINPTYAIQGSMIGRNDNAGPQGDGINVEVCFTQNTIDRHAVAQPIALQDITPREKAQNGKGWNADGTAYTVDTHATQGVAQPVPFQETADCLTSAYGTKWNGNASATNGSLFAAQAMAVRRLTPVECERLQGFPDGYTNIKAKGKPTPDGPRYKALGNSWAVPVVRWIGARIQEKINAP